MACVSEGRGVCLLLLRHLVKWLGASVRRLGKPSHPGYAPLALTLNETFSTCPSLAPLSHGHLPVFSLVRLSYFFKAQTPSPTPRVVLIQCACVHPHPSLSPKQTNSIFNSPSVA